MELSHNSLNKILIHYVSLKEFYDNNIEVLKIKPYHSPDLLNKKQITSKYISRPSLALSGYFEIFSQGRVLIIGNTEATYIQQIESHEMVSRLNRLTQFDIPCIIVANNNRLPDVFYQILEKSGIPILESGLSTDMVFYYLTSYLWVKFSDRTILHGCLVEVYGIGMLLQGKPGIGKSETALELINLGYRLIADDIVVVKKTIDNKLNGEPQKILQNFLEIRGIGIINLKEIFGIKAILNRKEIDIIVLLMVASEKEHFERLGITETKETILGVDLPVVKVPIRPGKNIASIIETIALNLISKKSGYDAPNILNEKILSYIKNQSGQEPSSMINRDS